MWEVKKEETWEYWMVGRILFEMQPLYRGPQDHYIFQFSASHTERIFPQIGNHVYMKSRVTCTSGDTVKCWTVLSLLISMEVKLSIENSYICTILPITPHCFFHSWENKIRNNVLAISRYIVGHTQTNVKTVTGECSLKTWYSCNSCLQQGHIKLFNLPLK